MTVEHDTVTLPAYWASALVNGDYSSLKDWEIEQLDKTVADLAPWYVVDIKRNDEGEAEDPRFTWNYSLYNRYSGYSGGEVLDYIVHKESK